MQQFSSGRQLNIAGYDVELMEDGQGLKTVAMILGVYGVIAISQGDHLEYFRWWLEEAGRDEEIGKIFKIVTFGWQIDQDDQLSVLLMDTTNGLWTQPVLVEHLIEALTAPVAGITIWSPIDEQAFSAPLSLDR